MVDVEWSCYQGDRLLRHDRARLQRRECARRVRRLQLRQAPADPGGPLQDALRIRILYGTNPGLDHSGTLAPFQQLRREPRRRRHGLRTTFRYRQRREQGPVTPWASSTVIVM